MHKILIFAVATVIFSTTVYAQDNTTPAPPQTTAIQPQLAPTPIPTATPQAQVPPQPVAPQQYQMIPVAPTQPSANVPVAPAPVIQTQPVYATQAPSIPSPTIANPNEGLRKRTHNLSFSVDSARTIFDHKKNGDLLGRSDTQTDELEFSYGFELGYVQPMIGVYSLKKTDKESGIKSNTGGFAFGSRFSFVKNEPGNDFIPFAQIMVGRIQADVSIDGLTNSIGGFLGGVGFGFDWYPLGEIFAIRPTFSYNIGKVKGSIQSENVDLEYMGSGLSVNYVFSF